MNFSNPSVRAVVEPFIAKHPKKASIDVVERFFISGDLILDSADSVGYDGGRIWTDSSSRSLSRKVHGWFFLRYWYSAWDQLSSGKKKELAETLKKMISSWKKNTPEESMAFHDETTAQRVINFVAFLDAARADLTLDLVTVLEELIDEETQLLASPAFYAGVNNHGMFQDIAILVSVAHGHGGTKAEELRSTAVDRAVNYFLSSFSVDGIHNENNPTYHMMVARYLAHMERYLEVTGEIGLRGKIHELLTRADEYGAYALTPEGSFVPISDTKKGQIARQSVIATFGEAKMLGSLTFGAEGILPESKSFVSETSGYGVYRSSWNAVANYLFFSSAYNADYHKHSDEMSVYYYANGRELISEAGPNGYEYRERLTQYAFSSAAHNTMLVDGVGLPRTDGKASQTTLEDEGTSKDSLDVTGLTTRFPGVKWARRVNVPAGSAGAFVAITDTVISEEEHSYTFLWHLGEGLDAVVRGNAIEIFDPETDEKLGELTWFSSTPVSVRRVQGQKHPYCQGWKFPRMGEHHSAVVIEVEYRARDLNIEWELRSDDFQIIDRGVTLSSEWKTHFAEKPVNYLLEGVETSDKVDSLLIAFTAMGKTNDFTYNYRASLKEFKGAVLYILDDFGDQGSYYLSSNRNLAEFRSVQSLIRLVASEMGISYGNIATIGSSKGGAAALLHGVTLGVGHVYAGAPQYRIGDFVRKPHPNVLQYISGGTDQACINWSNDIAFKVLSSGVRSTGITLLVGKKDGHYRHHTVPLVDDLRMLGYAPENLIVPGTPHSEFSVVFRKFLLSLVQAQEQKTPVSFANSIAFDSETKEIGLIVSGASDIKIQAQLFRDGEVYAPLQRVIRGASTWTVNEKGSYRARIYFDRPDNGERTAFSSAAVKVA